MGSLTVLHITPSNICQSQNSELPSKSTVSMYTVAYVHEYSVGLIRVYVCDMYRYLYCVVCGVHV